MDIYNKTSYQLAEKLTRNYSTSFSWSSYLFDKDTRKHIFAIYGMVRLADEVVDTYKGPEAKKLLDNFHKEVSHSLNAEYSNNPLVHAFGLTARKFNIEAGLVDSFFESMRSDLAKNVYRDKSELDDYIYGSAEVIGLMCLKVFVGGDTGKYNQLSEGARALGAAYQKVNFLRDMKNDYEELGRIYFPDVDYMTFSEEDKRKIIQDIRNDFHRANQHIDQLPKNARKAVRASYYHYTKLLNMIERSNVDKIKSERIRVPNIKKISFIIKATTQR